MALQNLSFEIAGASDGTAANWTVTTVATAEQVANFNGGTGPSRSMEGFELGWSNDTFATDITGGTGAIFNGTIAPSSLETFDRWTGRLIQDDFSGGIAATFGEDDGPMEGFELGWSNDTFATDITDGVTIEDDFSDWFDSVYQTDITSGYVAMFRTPAENEDIESFEYASPDREFFVASLETGWIQSLEPHGYESRQEVTVYTDDTLPGGMQTSRVYWVVEISTYELMLATTAPTGPLWEPEALMPTDYGSGRHFLHANPKKYWTTR